MPETERHLRTIIGLAMNKVSPDVRLACAGKRPKVDWTAWEVARLEMAEIIAWEVWESLDVRRKDFCSFGASTSHRMVPDAPLET